MIKDFATNKLILLYILTKVNSPIDISDLVDFMVQNDYADYFNIQQYMGDLLKSNFVHKISQNKKTLYMVTTEGTNALEYFMNRLPKDYLDIMDAFCAKIMNEYGDITLYSSTVTEYSKDKYQLNCLVTMNNIEIFSIKIPELSKEKAKYASEHWKDCGKEIYEYTKNKMGL